MAIVKKKSVAPFYAVAVVWLLWALLGPLYTVGQLIGAAGVSVLVFVLAKAIWPDRTWTTPEPDKEHEKKTPEPDTVPQEPARKSTGDPAIDGLIQERDRAVSEMKRLNDSIEDPTISAQIDRLEETTQKIIGVVVEKPEKLSQISRFLNYYLPTTLKLLNAYDRMDAAGVSGVNIDGTKGKIETMMETICRAFDKQLDALFGDEALDISSDIVVLEQMLQQEGIGADDPFAGTT